MTTRRTALVVGAGVSGLTTAIALRQAGWDVTVVDRGEGIDSRGAALGIWPHAWTGLRRLGVTERLRDCQPYTRATIRTDSGDLVGHLPLREIEKRYGRPVMLVSRPDLMTALAAAYAQSSDEPIRFGVRLADVASMRGHSLVVGADGINSSVPTAVFPGDHQPRRLGAAAWRGSCAGSADQWGEIWGRGVFAGLTPAGRGRTNWYVCHAGRDVPDRDALRALVRRWPGELADAIARTPDADLLHHDLYDLPTLRSYVRGPVALVGDAAHAMAPSLGQGACQAILDAITLVGLIDADQDTRRALRQYDAAMRPAGARLVRRSRRLLRVQHANWFAGLRNAAMRALLPLAPR
ncbi:NAD(P)/FAD-dependent oxidoreductase [Asanoa sp. WMMD1127]|uniref:FAD-dependent oxidoreductase n=1 Tax=Asanoa sp. WMMD1127 TaxID=3016107 RepID=UPI002416698D|nr:NAD(P)/FAD-dependent oxidoreductase [Asanoa sp. WMMD1127]MDG4825076.1 NAD(P)/FAD-dependent oxidoreductase [Asanoa sp. WMMD1127]